MSNTFQVPSQILADQAIKTSHLYKEDTPENQQLLAGIGLGKSKFDELQAMGVELNDYEAQQEMIRANAVSSQREATAAVQAIVDWRNQTVLPRVKIALKDDGKLRHFRPGKLRSTRAASVIREGRLLVSAMELFQNDERLMKRGINRALIDQGRALIADAEKDDNEAATAAMKSLDATERVYELEDRIDDILSDVEHCATVIFPSDSAALRRYRMNEIRNYIASRQGHTNVDASASIGLPDPVVETDETKAEVA